MNYIIIYIFLIPFKILMRLFKCRTKRQLVIQTAKIGDFINITPMLRALGKSEVLISEIVKPLACNDSTITKYFIIEEWKKNLFTKLKLVFKLMNRYDSIYLLQPNSINLFLASLCNSTNKYFLITYANKNYHKIFYRNVTKIIHHGKNSLTIDSYLKLINNNYCYKDFPKHATFPLFIPKYEINSIKYCNNIKIGISISAGNQSKTIPTKILYKIIKILNNIKCTFFIFGKKNEIFWLNKLLIKTKKQKNIVNLLGKIKLEELPWTISKMDFYISSDSGNAYIADVFYIPIILLYGPCSINEQRPINNVLFIGSDNINTSNFIFDNNFLFNNPKEILFKINDKKLIEIDQFVKKNLKNK